MICTNKIFKDLLPVYKQKLRYCIEEGNIKELDKRGLSEFKSESKKSD